MEDGDCVNLKVGDLELENGSLRYDGGTHGQNYSHPDLHALCFVHNPGVHTSLSTTLLSISTHIYLHLV